MRFAFIGKHRHIWPVSWLCKVLEVSRSGFHAWLNRPTSARRVWRDVLEDGLACGLHRIERLMRLNALRARPGRRGKPKDDGERSVIADNILNRDFQADRPNQKWLADFASRTFGSPISGPRKAGSMSPLCWICSRGARLVGP